MAKPKKEKPKPIAFKGSDVGKALRSLPLLDVYMDLQSTNLWIVDLHLQDLEAQMVREYYLTDKPPMELTTLVSALSQLWIFGLYADVEATDS